MSFDAEQAKQRFYVCLANIPAGKVISYGQLAELAGLKGRARWVGQMLMRLPEGSRLPWHRVINSQGKLSFPIDSTQYQVQRDLLEAEGVEFSLKGKIDLKKFGFV